VLGEKGIIVFSDVEHVILKSMSIVLYSLWLLRKFRKEQNFYFSISKFFIIGTPEMESLNSIVPSTAHLA
jgi:hypothetical protein